jgi:hypothetical protein
VVWDKNLRPGAQALDHRYSVAISTCPILFNACNNFRLKPPYWKFWRVDGPFRTPACAMYDRRELPLRRERRLRVRLQWAAPAPSAGIVLLDTGAFSPACATIAFFE